MWRPKALTQWDRPLRLTGGGEPTLHPAFNAIIDFTFNRTKLEQGLYTNGCHIDTARAPLLKEALTWCYGSLDCVDRETYLTEKRVDKFEQACQGVRELARADGRATVGVGFLIHGGNYSRVLDMRRLALDLGAQYVQFRPAVYFDVRQPGLSTETDWIDDALPELLDVAEFTQVQVDLDRFRMLRDWQGHGYLPSSQTGTPRRAMSSTRLVVML